MKLGIVDYKSPRWKEVIGEAFSRFNGDLFELPHDDPNTCHEVVPIEDCVIVLHSDGHWQWVKKLSHMGSVKRVVVVTDDQISLQLQATLQELASRADWLFFSKIHRSNLLKIEEEHLDRSQFLRDLGEVT